jgi:hypothetical protein
MERDGNRTAGQQAGAADGECEAVRRALDEREQEEKRQRGGSTPTEDVLTRALELENGVEWHAGEDAGEVPDSEE